MSKRSRNQVCRLFEILDVVNELGVAGAVEVTQRLRENGSTACRRTVNRDLAFLRNQGFIAISDEGQIRHYRPLKRLADVETGATC